MSSNNHFLKIMLLLHIFFPVYAKGTTFTKSSPRFSSAMTQTKIKRIRLTHYKITISSIITTTEKMLTCFLYQSPHLYQQTHTNQKWKETTISPSTTTKCGHKNHTHRQTSLHANDVRFSGELQYTKTTNVLPLKALDFTNFSFTVFSLSKLWVHFSVYCKNLLLTFPPTTHT